jgi:hypothetical protein
MIVCFANICARLTDLSSKRLSRSITSHGAVYAISTARLTGLIRCPSRRFSAFFESRHYLSSSQIPCTRHDPRSRRPPRSQHLRLRRIPRFAPYPMSTRDRGRLQSSLGRIQRGGTESHVASSSSACTDAWRSLTECNRDVRLANLRVP